MTSTADRDALAKWFCTVRSARATQLRKLQIYWQKRESSEQPFALPPRVPSIWFNLSNHESACGLSVCFYFVPGGDRIVYAWRMDYLSFLFGNMHATARLPVGTAAAGFAGLVLIGIAFILVFILLRGRASTERRRALGEALERRLLDLGHANAELKGSLRGMAETLAARQSDLARLVSDRLDSVGARVGQG